MFYRITHHEDRRYLVLPTLSSIGSLDEIYATRTAAQAVADRLNGIPREMLRGQGAKTATCESALSA
ncbi:MAG: hypothetical protein V3R99_00375 [Thermoguttaceae bacterium]